MNTQKIPVITMLLAGLTALVIMAIRGDMTLNRMLLTLFIVFLIFYILGDIIKSFADRKIRRIEDAEAREAEVLELEKQEAEEAAALKAEQESKQEAKEGGNKPEEKAGI